MTGIDRKSIFLYELKSLSRSIVLYLFPLFAVPLIIYVCGSMNYIWYRRCIQSAVPYNTVLVFDMVLAAFGVILITESLMLEYRISATDVVFPRSFTNFGYVIAKFAASLAAVFGVLGIVLFLAFLYNLLVMKDIPVSYTGFVLYPRSSVCPRWCSSSG